MYPPIHQVRDSWGSCVSFLDLHSLQVVADGDSWGSSELVSACHILNINMHDAIQPSIKNLCFFRSIRALLSSKIHKENVIFSVEIRERQVCAMLEINIHQTCSMTMGKPLYDNRVSPVLVVCWTAKI
ncbi:hypothetical protein OsI_02271 [Oryza sativa Indica Group]|uniref:Uncharacterized protein n=1 Tax=Oryza sativa subsp. indica TaxID=39946 RepID=B8A9M8_ORYSI|nr:hypothetical protein OsI_02271 [Oryza sativa Indica Group]